jgi:hypothetical protein
MEVRVSSISSLLVGFCNTNVLIEATLLEGTGLSTRGFFDLAYSGSDMHQHEGHIGASGSSDI